MDSSSARRRSRGSGVGGAWARGAALDGFLPIPSVLVDAREAETAGLDLAAAGFAQWFAGQTGTAGEGGEWLVAVATPYDLEVLRRRDFDPGALAQPSQMAGTFPDRHPDSWLEQAEAGGVAVLVVDGLTELDGFVDLAALESAWCVVAGLVRRH